MTQWVKRLLIANVLVYFLQQTVPALTGALILVPATVLMRPWTLITYMFLHDPQSLWHIIGNMLGLYFFGPRLEQRLGSNRFITLYMISGISGALLSFLTPYSAILGASGAVLGVTLAYARFWPRDQIYLWGIIPVEVRWLVAGYTLYSIFGVRSGGSGIAHFAHLGGMLGAFVYLQFIAKSAGTRQWEKKVAAAPQAKALGDWSRVDKSTIHEVNRDEVNRILDKISATGLSSLTPQERVFLSNFVPKDDRTPMA